MIELLKAHPYIAIVIAICLALVLVAAMYFGVDLMPWFEALRWWD